jgi:hypothetical protein
VLSCKILLSLRQVWRESEKRFRNPPSFFTHLIIENLQRQDVHPLEEADGYKALLDSTPSCTTDEVAAKVGKSKAYVYQRLSGPRGRGD